MRISFALILMLFSLSLVSCVNGSLFVSEDKTLYWQSRVEVEPQPAPEQHVAFIIDDSSSMSGEIENLSKALQVLISKMGDEGINFNLHMVRLSQVLVDPTEQTARIPQKIDFQISGGAEVANQLLRLTVADSVKEYGLTSLVALMKKSFIRAEDITSFEDLVPHKEFIVPRLKSSAQEYLSQFFNVLLAGTQLQLNEEKWGYFFENSPEALKTRDRNLNLISSHYSSYYLYRYIRDQIIGSRTRRWFYPVIITDQEDYLVRSNGSGRKGDLFASAESVQSWAKSYLPDVSMRVSAVISEEGESCEDDIPSAEASDGASYRDLAERTGGSVQNICKLQSKEAFSAFLETLGNSVLENNFQSIVLTGPVAGGRFEVRDLTDDVELEEGVHYHLNLNGADNKNSFGYVELVPGTIAAGHLVEARLIKTDREPETETFR